MKISKNFFFNNIIHEFSLIQGDISEQNTDIIVNAANKFLKLGSGVAGAIRIKGGPTIQEECDKIGEIKVGDAILTTAGLLNSKYVIHAVGPVYSENSHQKSCELLQNCIFRSIKILQEKKLKSITFPAISTGVFGFPKDKAARIICNSIFYSLKNAQYSLKIHICLFAKEDFIIFRKIMEEILDD